jgi:hypothetical protein
MSYIEVNLENKESSVDRPFYTATITQTGKIEIPFEVQAKSSRFFINILHSNDTAINSYQIKHHKLSTYIPLIAENSIELLEQNANYDVFFPKATTFWLPENGKVTHFLIDIQSLGALNKIIIEFSTNTN